MAQPYSGARSSHGTGRAAWRSAMDGERRVIEVKVDGHTLEITHPDRVLFPADGITKADLVGYYQRIGPLMLEHLRGRPLILQRFPGGIQRGGFIQQAISDRFPAWLHRVTVPKEHGTVTHAVCNDVASIVYLAGQACITFHPWLSRADRPHHPDQLIFDLDPAGDDFAEVRAAALVLREVLDTLGLPSFVKVTGSRGAHVLVPLDRSATFDEVRAFARRVAEDLIGRAPERRTLEPRKDKRGGRLLVDIMRNAYGQTAVAPYAVRALPGAPVAMPLTWQELEQAERGPRTVTLRNVQGYLAAHDDPWRDLARNASQLP